MPTEKEKDDPYAAGMEAHDTGQDRASNPFDPNENPDAYWDWYDGYDYAANTDE